MSKRNSLRISQPNLEIPMVKVPCQFRQQEAAFLLGVRDAFTRSRVERSFAYFTTETAYSAGITAGLAARAMRKGANR